MEKFDSEKLEELLKVNKITFTRENWNTNTVNNLIPYINRYFKNKNKTISKRYSSTKLKSIFIKLTDSRYLTLEDFIVAMLAAGFNCKNIKFTYYFNVAEKDIKAIDKIINPEFYV